MVTRKLRAVTENDKPQPPPTLADVSKLSRRELLIVARENIAAQIYAGKVPAHALGRLHREMLNIDDEIRQLDARAKQAAEDSGVTGDENFDASAI